MVSFQFLRRLLLIFPAILFLLSTACNDPTTTTPLPPDAVIVAFGDSITYGTGASREQSYPQLLEELVGREVINAGIPGETTAEGLARLPGVLESERPDLLILCLGGNDFLRKLDDGEVEKNLAAMVRLARDRGTEVVLLGVPRVGFALKTHPLYARIAKEHHVPLQGKALQQILSDRSLRSDYIHPNADGYRQLAESVAELLKKMGYVAR